MWPQCLVYLIIRPHQEGAGPLPLVGSGRASSIRGEGQIVTGNAVGAGNSGNLLIVDVSSYK
jgi:hypothetical protein